MYISYESSTKTKSINSLMQYHYGREPKFLNSRYLTQLSNYSSHHKIMMIMSSGWRGIEGHDGSLLVKRRCTQKTINPNEQSRGPISHTNTPRKQKVGKFQSHIGYFSLYLLEPGIFKIDVSLGRYFLFFYQDLWRLYLRFKIIYMTFYDLFSVGVQLFVENILLNQNF